MSNFLIVGPKYTLAARMLPPGESRWVYAARSKVRKKTGVGTDGRTDGLTPDSYITLTARRGHRNNLFDDSDRRLSNIFSLTTAIFN